MLKITVAVSALLRASRLAVRSSLASARSRYKHAVWPQLLGVVLSLVYASAGVFGCRIVSTVEIESQQNDSQSDESSSIGDTAHTTTVDDTTTSTDDTTPNNTTSSSDPTATATNTTTTSETSTSSDHSSSTDSTDDFTCTVPPAIKPCDGSDGEFRAIELGCPDDVEGVSTLLYFDKKAMNGTTAITRYFGNSFWVPTRLDGAAMLLMTTGKVEADPIDRVVKLANQVVDENSGNNGNDDIAFPKPISRKMGSNNGNGGDPWRGCDGVNDCSDSLNEAIHDPSILADVEWLHFKVRVPRGVHGFALDLAFFSAEFARRLGTDEDFDDIAVVWVTGQAFTGNLATYDNHALTPRHMLDFLLARGTFGTGSNGPLTDTGFLGVDSVTCEIPGEEFMSCPRGVATPWMTLRGPAVPGEELEVMIALADQGTSPSNPGVADDAFDSILLVDNWRWECEACVPLSTCGMRVRQ